MSRWLALAMEPQLDTQTPPDNMTKPDKTPSTQPEGAFCQVLSNCQVKGESKDPNLKDSPNVDDMRHGFAVNGHPKTWVGKVVSLADWRGFSEWDRHGSTGKMYCGACREWLIDCEHISAAKGREGA